MITPPHNYDPSGVLNPEGDYVTNRQLSCQNHPPKRKRCFGKVLGIVGKHGTNEESMIAP